MNEGKHILIYRCLIEQHTDLLHKSEIDPLVTELNQTWYEFMSVITLQINIDTPSVSFGIEQAPQRENLPFECFVKHNLCLMYYVKNSKQ